MAQQRPKAGVRALALPRPAALRWPRFGFGARLKALWLEECEHGLMALMPALAFACGVLIYFAAPDEPWPLAPALMSLVCLALATVFRAHYRAFVGFGLLAALLAGIALPALKAAFLPKPLSPLRMQAAMVEGLVEMAEQRGSGTRFIVRLTGGDLPAGARVRITSRRIEPLAVVGQAVSVKARLGAPSGPSYPGGYDFARDAYFDGIIGVGYTLGKLSPADSGPLPLRLRFGALVAEARNAISARIRAHIDGENGRIADALVTGKRDGITAVTNDTLRAAGVFHILSVSGFHMALVSVMIFAAVRGLLALVPPLALNLPAKRVAAAVALLVASLYLFLSGAEVATQRSWVMIAVVLIGTMAGREALSLRSLAVAVVLVLIVTPESLLGPSFQMSFAATLALVSGLRFVLPAIEQLPDRKADARVVAHQFTHGVLGLATSSFLAGLATTPYGAFHFQGIQPYGVLGNLLGGPIIEFLTMPLEILALMLWPLGLDGMVWAMVGVTVEWFMMASRFVASIKGGSLQVHAFPVGALLLMTLALLVVGLFKTRLRLLGLLPFVVGLAWAVATPLPLGFIDRRAETALLAGESSAVMIGHKPNRFVGNQWLSALGRGGDKPASGRCDTRGCAGQGGGVTLAMPRSANALADDCALADIVVAWEPLALCKARLVTRDELMRAGGFALYRTGKGLSLKPVRGAGHRPWHGTLPAAAPAPTPADESAPELD